MSDNYIYQYYQAIKDGRETVGRWIIAVYEMVIHGIESKEFYLDQKKANRAVKFIESFCHHSKGYDGLLKLELWQKAMISTIFGIVDEDGNRHFREVLCEVGRKVGKTLIASGIAQYMAYGDGERGADVYFLAPKLDQTDIVYNAFLNSVESEEELRSITKRRKTDLYIASTNTSIKKIAFSQRKSDGFNPHLTICDELAAWQGDAGIKQYEVMASALGSRKQPLILSITTANYITDGIFDELYKRSTRVLMGDSKEKRLLPFLYQIDDVSKWNDISELKKSLPNLGVSVSVDFMLEEIAKAEGSLASRAEFMCKYACVQQNSAQAWLRSEIVEVACGEELKLEDFRDCYCVLGIDLSRTTDLTAVTTVIERSGELYVFCRFFMPAEKIQEATARDGIPYEIYVKRGLLTLSGENFVDYHDCENYIKSLVMEYKIYPLKCGYDRYSAQYLIQDLSTAGFHMDDVFQGTNLTPVINETEGLLNDKKIHIGNNDLLKIHLLNTVKKVEAETERCKIVKLSTTAHIDGTAALLDAMCMRSRYHEEIGRSLENRRGAN